MLISYLKIFDPKKIKFKLLNTTRNDIKNK